MKDIKVVKQKYLNKLNCWDFFLYLLKLYVELWKVFDINGNGQVSRFGFWSGQVIHFTRQNMDKFDIFYPEKIYDSKSQTMF